jgi:DNA-binding transcriptional MerR regulator
VELTIRELAAAAAQAVATANVRGANRRVTDLPDERTIRWYTTIGLLDRPSGNRGRTALYGERHLLQLVAIKRRQAEGRPLSEIQAELVGATDRTLRRIAALPADVSGAARGCAAAPEPSSAERPRPRAERAFWRERPATDKAVPVLSGVDLGGGVVLMLPVQPDRDDVDLIQAAAQPLVELLAQRRLTRRSTE